MDGHVLSAQNGKTAICVCGEERPSRQHLLWRCPQASHGLRACVDEGERRLLTVSIPHPPAVRDRDLQQAAAALCGHLRQCVFTGRPVLATDGASSGVWRRASWAVVCQCGAQFSGELPGLDQTSVAAEIFALCIVSDALSSMALSADVVSDSLLAVTLSRRRTSPRFFSAAWVCLRSCFTAGSSLSWVPSHGKKPEWRHEDLDSGLVKRLNHLADAAATAVFGGPSELEVSLGRAGQWMTVALQSMVGSSLRLVANNAAPSERE